MLLSELPEAWLLGAALLLGLVWGSFLNVVIHRLPRGQSLMRPASSCPACGARIQPWDNVPLVSWLLLRGRARCCRASISPRYPLVEALGGACGWAVMACSVLTLPGDTTLVRGLAIFGLYFALTLGLLAALFIDLSTMLLPDEITLGGAALGLLSAPLRGLSWWDAVIGAAVGYLVIWFPFDRVYRWLRGHPGMGLGDAKLLALAGAWFGWPWALFTLGAAAVQGTLVAVTVYLVRGKIDEPEAVRSEREELRGALRELPEEERRRLEAEMARDPLASEPEAGLGQARLAFGPFLVLALFEVLFFRESLNEWFLVYVWET